MESVDKVVKSIFVWIILLLLLSTPIECFQGALLGKVHGCQADPAVVGDCPAIGKCFVPSMLCLFTLKTSAFFEFDKDL